MVNKILLKYHIYSENDRMGAFVINAFKNIRDSATDISKEEECAYIKAFDDRKEND